MLDANHERTKLACRDTRGQRLSMFVVAPCDSVWDIGLPLCHSLYFYMTTIIQTLFPQQIDTVAVFSEFNLCW